MQYLQTVLRPRPHVPPPSVGTLIWCTWGNWWCICGWVLMRLWVVWREVSWGLLGTGTSQKWRLGGPSAPHRVLWDRDRRYSGWSVTLDPLGPRWGRPVPHAPHDCCSDFQCRAADGHRQRACLYPPSAPSLNGCQAQSVQEFMLHCHVTSPSDHP